MDLSSGLPPGVSDEDLLLFKQAQEKAQEALLEVGSFAFIFMIKKIKFSPFLII